MTDVERGMRTYIRMKLCTQGGIYLVCEWHSLMAWRIPDELSTVKLLQVADTC